MFANQNPMPYPKTFTPWNKGKVTGTKPPLKTKEIWDIKSQLQFSGNTRDLALSIPIRRRKS